MSDAVDSPAGTGDTRQTWLEQLGPGLVTGAADDDPSGIGTYSQVGAQFGFALGGAMILSFPLMAATQAICARIGAATGRGIASNLRRHYPPWLTHAAVLLLLAANIFNLGADLGAMAAVLQIAIPGPHLAFTFGFAIVSILLEVLVRYDRYAPALKWASLSLLAYVGVVFAVRFPLVPALHDLLLPRFPLDRVHVTALVAALGTTISPYLFFWQPAQEIEEQHRRRVPALVHQPARAKAELRRIDTDTLVGMAYSNLIALFIIVATAATLHRQGIVDIGSADQAALALRPIAGDFAFALFALGIIGTGLLAVPVLAGSAAYAVSETLGWREGLARPWHRARAFYSVIALATLAGAALELLAINPMRALYWAAVLNGLLAPPLMVVTLLVAANRTIMGPVAIRGPLAWCGWLSTAVMALAGALFLTT
jgi:Mn2+/Fe2+ NRAMP family transporter